MNTLHWGILGTGNIARQFAQGVAGATRSRVVAVGSRSIDSAQAFAQIHGIPTSHGSYDALLHDPSVQAVYLSLPNSMHHQWTIKALRAGKHVLCEKPIASNRKQAAEMFEVAEKRGLTLIEAFMYRCHPLTHAWMDRVRAGDIGSVKLVRASFCFHLTKTDGNIRFSRELAGGALMDVGCYCLNLARLVYGDEPVRVQAVGQLHDAGVDEFAAGTLEFSGGRLAQFVCGMKVHADNTAFLCGDRGYISIPIPWKPPVEKAQFTIAQSIPARMEGGAVKSPPPRETVEVNSSTPLYGLEADAFADCVLDGKKPFVTADDTLGNMKLLDQLRKMIGVTA